MGAQSSTLTPQNIKDLSKATAFSKKEIKAWFSSFKQDCPSGKLTMKEFKELYTQFFPSGDPTEFAKHAFRKQFTVTPSTDKIWIHQKMKKGASYTTYIYRTFDDNNDGSIDFQEFMCALSVTSRGSFEEKLEWAYSMYDQDQDGNITKNEMLNIFNAIYKMIGENKIAEMASDELSPQQRVDDLFQRVDKDGNQKITLQEFKQAAKDDPSLVMLLHVNGGAQ